MGLDSAAPDQTAENSEENADHCAHHHILRVMLVVLDASDGGDDGQEHDQKDAYVAKPVRRPRRKSFPNVNTDEDGPEDRNLCVARWERFSGVVQILCFGCIGAFVVKDISVLRRPRLRRPANIIKQFARQAKLEEKGSQSADDELHGVAEQTGQDPGKVEMDLRVQASVAIASNSLEDPEPNGRQGEEEEEGEPVGDGVYVFVITNGRVVAEEAPLRHRKYHRKLEDGVDSDAGDQGKETQDDAHEVSLQHDARQRVVVVVELTTLSKSKSKTLEKKVYFK